MEVPMNARHLFLAAVPSLILAISWPRLATAQSTTIVASVRDSAGAPVLPSRIDVLGNLCLCSRRQPGTCGAAQSPSWAPDASSSRYWLRGAAGRGRRHERYAAASACRAPSDSHGRVGARRRLLVLAAAREGWRLTSA